jgi:hypothetical protein
MKIFTQLSSQGGFMKKVLAMALVGFSIWAGFLSLMKLRPNNLRMVVTNVEEHEEATAKHPFYTFCFKTFDDLQLMTVINVTNPDKTLETAINRHDYYNIRNC